MDGAQTAAFKLLVFVLLVVATPQKIVSNMTLVVLDFVLSLHTGLAFGSSDYLLCFSCVWQQG